MERTIAVVVTYNRRPLLEECITALRNQTHQLDSILVINNGSTDDTEQWLLSQPDISFITQKNVGSSGGFNTGINSAFKQNFSWIWCMDDDGYPKEDALEKLLDADTEILSLRNCAVINKEDKKTFVWKTKDYATIDDVDTKLIRGIAHPFNGTLLHRNIVERVGLPKPALFLWGDETEYYYRITRKNNIPVYTVADSIHYHPATAFTYKQDWDYAKCWKMYYYVRNRFHIQKSKSGNILLAFICYCCFLAAMAGIVLIYQKTNKSKKLWFLVWPAVDAFINDYTATPPLILAKLKIGPNRVLKNSFYKYVKNIWTTILVPAQPLPANRALNM